MHLNDAGSGEHWLPPAGGTMLGVSRTVKNGKPVELEFIQLRANAEGKLVFIARIEGTRDGKVRGVDFPMKRVSCDALAGVSAPPASTAGHDSRN